MEEVEKRQKGFVFHDLPPAPCLFTLMEGMATKILLAPLLLAVVSSSNRTSNLTTLPSLPASPSKPSSTAPSSSSLTPLCPCVPSNMLPDQAPPSPSLSPAPTPLTQIPPLPAPHTLALLLLLDGADPCGGVVYLRLGGGQLRPVCVGSIVNGSQLCEVARCGVYQSRRASHESPEGLQIQEDGAVRNETCDVLEIQCADSVSWQLAAYKWVTGLLSVALLLFILLRFRPHIYTIANKRLFGRRKREWIGPTESVSFRVQNTLHPNSNADKRLSFPGLERLTVNNSREPSSNRNSDYDSY
ncbi:hypothetical protein GJAV_G00248860 [Gymnothorax javanicus]|nr:hypothetical protein GJAV_G00248860 [Gymnothorax javanicus]